MLNLSAAGELVAGQGRSHQDRRLWPLQRGHPVGQDHQGRSLLWNCFDFFCLCKEDVQQCGGRRPFLNKQNCYIRGKWPVDAEHCFVSLFDTNATSLKRPCYQCRSILGVSGAQIDSQVSCKKFAGLKTKFSLSKKLSFAFIADVLWNTRVPSSRGAGGQRLWQSCWLVRTSLLCTCLIQKSFLLFFFGYM